MRISDHNSIAISATAKDLSSLRELAKGSEVSARIMEQVGPGRALLEVLGRRVHADFLRGVPRQRHIRLVLESAVKDSLVFRLSSGDSRAHALERLSEFTVFTAGELKGRLPRINADFLKEAPPGVFAYNLILVWQQVKGERPRVRVADILNRMLARGMKIEHLALFSYLFSLRGGINIDNLIPLLRILAGDGRGGVPGEGEKGSGKEDLPGAVKDMVREIDARTAEGDGLLAELLEALSYGDFAVPRKAAHGSIPYLDEGAFKEAEYIARKDALLASFDFTILGHVDVLCRHAGSVLGISLFCDSERAREFLDRETGSLREAVAGATGRIAQVNIYVNSHVLQNIFEINSLLISNGTFDKKA